MKRRLFAFMTTFALCASMLSVTCFASELDANTTTGEMTVIVDTTKTQSEGGSLPATFSYKVTVPADLVLTPKEETTCVGADIPFGQSTNIVIKGVASHGKHIKVQVSSTDTTDSECGLTLKESTNESVKTTGGTFYIGTPGNSAYEASSTDDTSAMLSSAGLSVPLVVSGVKGISTFGVFTGSLRFTVSEETN